MCNCRVHHSTTPCLPSRTKYLGKEIDPPLLISIEKKGKKTYLIKHLINISIYMYMCINCFLSKLRSCKPLNQKNIQQHSFPRALFLISIIYLINSSETVSFSSTNTPAGKKMLTIKDRSPPVHLS